VPPLVHCGYKQTARNSSFLLLYYRHGYLLFLCYPEIPKERLVLLSYINPIFKSFLKNAANEPKSKDRKTQCFLHL